MTCGSFRRNTSHPPILFEGRSLVEFPPESGCAPNVGDDLRTYSCKTTVSSDLLTLILPLYSMKPSFLNLFMKKFTRERVVPTMLARVSCETFDKMRTG